MPRGDESLDLNFSDRDDDAEDLGYGGGGGGGGGGGASYDDDDEEDGGWAINKDQTEDLWDSAEGSDDEEEGEEGATEVEGDDEESETFMPRSGRGAGRPPRSLARDAETRCA